jgi:hypothetical protein
MARSLLCCLSLAAVACQAQPLTQSDRDFAVSAMHATRKQFLDTVAGLSPAQLKWKPAPEVWSVQEIAEHIAISDEGIPQVAAKAVQAPATPEKRKPNPRAADALLLKQLPVRDKKFKAPEGFVPSGKFKNLAAITAAFKTARDRNIAYVRETNDDLRSHFAAHPVFGDLDALQWYVLMAGHTERHILQIKEVMATPGFPAK